MPKGRGNGKGAPEKGTVAPRPRNKPDMWVEGGELHFLTACVG